MVNKKIIFLVCFLGLGVLSFYPFNIYKFTNKQFVKYSNSFEYKISGINYLKEKDVSKFLPNKNFIWFLFNNTSLELSIRTNSLIKNASINRCSFWDFNCINIKIQEREPSFVVKNNKNLWVVSSDGSILSKLPTKTNISKIKLPIVEGLIKSDLNLFDQQALLKDLSNKINISSEKLNIKPVRILVDKQNAEFKYQKFNINFNFEKDFNDSLSQARSTLNSYSDSLDRISSINLVYGNVGIVKHRKES